MNGVRATTNASLIFHFSGNSCTFIHFSIFFMCLTFLPANLDHAIKELLLSILLQKFLWKSYRQDFLPKTRGPIALLQEFVQLDSVHTFLIEYLDYTTNSALPWNLSTVSPYAHQSPKILQFLNQLCKQ